jgi:membrane protein implicated in regulation of membrane protease activity
MKTKGTKKRHNNHDFMWFDKAFATVFTAFAVFLALCMIRFRAYGAFHWWMLFVSIAIVCVLSYDYCKKREEDRENPGNEQKEVETQDFEIDFTKE